MCILFFAIVLAFYFNLEANQKMSSVHQPLIEKDIEYGRDGEANE